MTTADAFDRARAIDRLETDAFDLVVVGGGITGAGVTLDAANRGLTTALVEQRDFASGTSSKSSKLIHGGLRYLQQGEMGLVYEALAERQILRKTAPHLVGVMPFLIPMFKRNGLLNPRIARALGLAMWQYDLTGGLRIGKRHRRLSRAATLDHMPSLNGDNLDSSYLYYDAHADDARLTLEIIRTAVLRHGAVAANRCAVTAISMTEAGARRDANIVTVQVDGRSIDISTRCVVNAAGVWTDSVRAMDEGTDPKSIRPAKGVHVAVRQSRLQTDVAVVMPVPGDRRSVFVVPWDDVTYIGTTDTDYQGPLDDLSCTIEDVEYLLGAVNHSTSADLTSEDIVGSWAGLRPLVTSDESGRTADLSRRHSIATSDSGVISVTGGKLTTYRRMASDAVDQVVAQLGLKRRCRTAKLPLLGASDGAAPEDRLHSRYGTQRRAITAMIDTDPELGEALVPGLRYCKAEAIYAIRHEMATTLDDVLSRRTRARLFDADACRAAACDVAELIAPELGWSRDRVDHEIAAFRSLIDDDLESSASTLERDGER